MTIVLVVDDSQTVRELVSEHLRLSNFTIVEAFDGLDATEKIKISVPDLVITDVVMPRMNGYELCRWIKANVKNKTVPVIMCSTKSEEFDKYWGMKQGADAYITKPYVPAELINIVKRLIRMMKDA